MSSPLGGFYLSAQQRKMHAEQRESNTPKCRLQLSLTSDHQLLIEQLLTLKPGTSEIANRAVSIQLSSSFTPTGLLKVVSDIYYALLMNLATLASKNSTSALMIP